MREQRQRAGLAFDLAHEQVDQARFEQETALVGRAFDRSPEVRLGHWRQQVESPFDEAREADLGRHVAEPVGAHRDDEWRVLGPVGERGEEPRLLGAVAAQRHRLLALVDDEDGSRSRVRDRREGVHRAAARRDDHNPATVAEERGRHPGSHQR